MLTKKEPPLEAPFIIYQSFNLGAYEISPLSQSDRRHFLFSYILH